MNHQVNQQMNHQTNQVLKHATIHQNQKAKNWKKVKWVKL